MHTEIGDSLPFSEVSTSFLCIQRFQPMRPNGFGDPLNFPVEQLNFFCFIAK